MSTVLLYFKCSILVGTIHKLDLTNKNSFQVPDSWWNEPFECQTSLVFGFLCIQLKMTNSVRILILDYSFIQILRIWMVRLLLKLIFFHVTLLRKPGTFVTSHLILGQQIACDSNVATNWRVTLLNGFHWYYKIFVFFQSFFRIVLTFLWAFFFFLWGKTTADMKACSKSESSEFSQSILWNGTCDAF